MMGHLLKLAVCLLLNLSLIQCVDEVICREKCRVFWEYCEKWGPEGVRGTCRLCMEICDCVQTQSLPQCEEDCPGFYKDHVQGQCAQDKRSGSIHPPIALMVTPSPSADGDRGDKCQYYGYQIALAVVSLWAAVFTVLCVYFVCKKYGNWCPF